MTVLRDSTHVASSIAGILIGTASALACSSGHPSPVHGTGASTPASSVTHGPDERRAEPRHAKGDAFDDPHRDTDADGVPDASDRCPTQAGPVHRDANFRGCPEVGREPPSPVALLLDFPEPSSSLQAALKDQDQWRRLIEIYANGEWCVRVTSFLLPPASPAGEKRGKLRAEAARKSLIDGGVKPERVLSNPNETPSERVMADFGRGALERSVLLEPVSCPRATPVGQGS